MLLRRFDWNAVEIAQPTGATHLSNCRSTAANTGRQCPGHPNTGQPRDQKTAIESITCTSCINHLDRQGRAMMHIALTLGARTPRPIFHDGKGRRVGRKATVYEGSVFRRIGQEQVNLGDKARHISTLMDQGVIPTTIKRYRHLAGTRTCDKVGMLDQCPQFSDMQMAPISGPLGIR